MINTILSSFTHSRELIHIILSTLAFSVLCIAALQAILLAVMEWRIRHQPGSKLLQILPPLELMESILFKIIVVGFVCLTAVLITSVWWFYPKLLTSMWHKSLLALVAWLVFTVLLLGRYLFGWRGQQVVRWTLSGVILVMLTYFSSEFL